MEGNLYRCRTWAVGENDIDLVATYRLEKGVENLKGVLALPQIRHSLSIAVALAGNVSLSGG